MNNPIKFIDTDGRDTTPSNSNVDTKGIIRNIPTDQIFKGDLGDIGNRLLIRVSFEILELMGLNGIDNAIADWSNPDKSTVTKVAETTQAAMGLWIPGESMPKGSGKFTEPTLPPKTIVKENGVEIVHYTKSGDHGPPHVHVKGGGAETKIGQNGNPIKNSPELTTTQQQVVTGNKQTIRKAVNKIGKYHNYQKKQNP